MTEPLFFAPVFKERIWGGTHLTAFGYEIPSNQTGECWAFAAHQHGQSIVKNGKYKGLSLGELWEEHRGLFGNVEGDRFPLLTKILDANQDLSVQVHPNDEYASVHENGELGKTECWYVIDSTKDAEIIYGHHAKTKEEFMSMIEQKEWNQLLHRVKVKPGDFFYVPSGTVHAIGKGILVLETQQNSDTTYRLYDYDRRDSEGNLRDLHLERSIDVIETPYISNQLTIKHEKVDDLCITNFIKCPYFSVEKWELDGSASLEQQKDFLLVSVIKGEGALVKEGKHYLFKKGDHFIIPNYFGGYDLVGNSICIASSI
ncbi:mannose-6-phosphate isomerase, class I [Bacillus thuringiensis]|uniref:mannose-6-phosphate isomerase, class I n=1 Tax=Bacillus thuringiensis TaxID=1428 RepID=UPI000676C58C|nr:mannose-6-phosphate isomerase, class I [Bacillus thuringiensis]AKR12925.1 mannose-6-phosphate isomerase [Bacillus thuringiensis]MBZ8125878.1 mannose-6-phosphate isomerase, class I [Bacillus thuringiensis]